MFKKELSDDVICNLYSKGMKTKDIGSKANISPRQVRRILNKNNIIVKNIGNTKYKINECYFSEWNEDMAYILGFIYADGNIKNNTLSIYQKEKEILNDINKKMCSDRKIIKNKNNKNSYIHVLKITSKKIVNDLKEIGVVENKSLNIQPPKNIPNIYIKDFIRGIFDGDGWIHAKGYIANITSGSKDLADWILNQFIDLDLNADITEEISKNKYYRIWVRSKQDIFCLGKWFYENENCIKLENKYFRFKQLEKYEKTLNYNLELKKEMNLPKGINYNNGKYIINNKKYLGKFNTLEEAINDDKRHTEWSQSQCYGYYYDNYHSYLNNKCSNCTIKNNCKLISFHK